MDSTSPSFCSRSTARRDRQRRAQETMGRCDWSPPEDSASCEGESRDKLDPGILQKICRPGATGATAERKLAKRTWKTFVAKTQELRKGKAFLLHGIWLADQDETKVYFRDGPCQWLLEAPVVFLMGTISWSLTRPPTRTGGQQTRHETLYALAGSTGVSDTT